MMLLHLCIWWLSTYIDKSSWWLWPLTTCNSPIRRVSRNNIVAVVYQTRPSLSMWFQMSGQSVTSKIPEMVTAFSVSWYPHHDPVSPIRPMWHNQGGGDLRCWQHAATFKAWWLRGRHVKCQTALVTWLCRRGRVDEGLSWGMCGSKGRHVASWKHLWSNCLILPLVAVVLPWRWEACLIKVAPIQSRQGTRGMVSVQQQQLDPLVKLI